MLFLLLALFESAWNALAARAEWQGSALAQRTLDFLVETPGWPVEWNESNFVTLGLASVEPGRIEERQLKNLLDANYSKVREALGIARYGFYFNLTYANGSLASAEGANASYGVWPANATRAAAHQALVLYRGTRAKMNVVVWQ
ncbi:MAG: hypothetical protein QXH27_02010 [Candidatus Micrarchaeia archaeon]